MPYKKIIPLINTEGEISANVVRLADRYCDSGADELLLYNFSKDENSKEEILKLSKNLKRTVDIPYIIGFFAKNFDDIKRVLYTGASGILLSNSLLNQPDLIKYASERFGKNKIYLEARQEDILQSDEIFETCEKLGIGTLVIDHIDTSEAFVSKLSKSPVSVIIRDDLQKNDIRNLFNIPNVIGITTEFYKDKDILKAKLALKEENISVNIFESKIPFSEFKINEAGLIPVITQDYKTGEVLMLAYMNEEAYNRTITEGRMTYYSRSRKSLWLKGETSGNYQYVKALYTDCDKDTLLAKVRQTGPACHTGNKSCFYTSLLNNEYKESDPYRIFQSVYDVIMDRKKNPKEGSYTNYLFEKGIDKILKKCGEETAEIIIAAKNQNVDELRYEIADFLYHLMVLMAECGLDWDDIASELADRK